MCRSYPDSNQKVIKLHGTFSSFNLEQWKHNLLFSTFNIGLAAIICDIVACTHVTPLSIGINGTKIHRENGKLKNKTPAISGMYNSGIGTPPFIINNKIVILTSRRKEAYVVSPAAPPEDSWYREHADAIISITLSVNKNHYKHFSSREPVACLCRLFHAGIVPENPHLNSLSHP